MSDLETLVGALRRLQTLHGKFTVEMGFADVLAIIAHLQLALRHPDNVGSSRTAVREIVDGMIAALEREEPVLGPILRRGDDPRYDAPRGALQ